MLKNRANTALVISDLVSGGRACTCYQGVTPVHNKPTGEAMYCPKGEAEGGSKMMVPELGFQG